MKITLDNGYYVLSQGGAPMARSRRLCVLTRRWPEATVVVESLR